MLAYFFYFGLISYDGSNLSYIQNSILVYLEKGMIYLYIEYLMMSMELILLTIMSIYYISIIVELFAFILEFHLTFNMSLT